MFYVDSGNFQCFSGVVAGFDVFASRAPYAAADGTRLWRASVALDGCSAQGSGRCAVAAVRAAFAVVTAIGAVPPPSGGGTPAQLERGGWLDAEPTEAELEADFESREPMCELLKIAAPLWFTNVFESYRMFKGEMKLDGHPYRVEVTPVKSSGRFMAIIETGEELVYPIRAMGETPTEAINNALIKFNNY